MLNPRLAGRYAKSLIDLAVERNQLEEAHKDMVFLQALCKSNPDFVALLKSPVISADKKQAILKALTEGKVSEITAAFNALLIRKGRESILPQIAPAFIEQYRQLKGIQTVRLTTATPVSEELKKTIVDKVKAQMPSKNIELTALVDEGLIGGFVLQIGDTLVDASISYDLNTIRKQFLNNDFIYNIR
ncbi:MAG TPA: ATP synthase F1 subunit delta [Flavitalea sp.]|nr:ATP synthase F1 subunit delta [Flavitalea sp.]